MSRVLIVKLKVKVLRENDSETQNSFNVSDFARESFCFGSEAVNESGEAVRRLVKSPVEFPPAQIRGVF